MPSYFSISEKPSASSYSQTMISDPVHRAESESGTLLTRTRSTAVPPVRTIFYRSLSESSKQTIEDWEKDTIGYGGQAFNWTDPNPLDRVTYGAALIAPINFNLHPQDPTKWQARFKIALLSESSSSSSLSSSSLSSSSSSFSSST